MNLNKFMRDRNLIKNQKKYDCKFGKHVKNFTNRKQTYFCDIIHVLYIYIICSFF